MKPVTVTNGAGHPLPLPSFCGHFAAGAIGMNVRTPLLPDAVLCPSRNADDTKIRENRKQETDAGLPN